MFDLTIYIVINKVSKDNNIGDEYIISYSHRGKNVMRVYSKVNFKLQRVYKKGQTNGIPTVQWANIGYFPSR